MVRQASLIVIALLAANLAHEGVVLGQNSLRAGLISAGASRSESNSYILHGTLGQATTGRSSSSTYNAYAGFWYEVVPPAGPLALPLAAGDTVTIDEDTAARIDVLANDTDTGSGRLRIVGYSEPRKGQVDRASDRELSYRPDANFNGIDRFTYTVANTAGGTAQATVSITVRPVNDAPEFISDPVTGAAADAPFEYEVETTDVDGETPKLTALQLPNWLTLTDAGEGSALLSGTPTNLEAGEHEVVLEASDGIASSTQEFTVTVIQGIPAVPVLTAPENGASSVPVTVTLTWQEVAGTSEYHVQLSTQADFASTMVDTAGLAASSLELEGLTEGSSYYWRVEAINAAGASGFPAPFSFSTATGVAVEQVDDKPVSFRLDQNYPNPFNPSTQIGYELAQRVPVRLAVYDALGREVAVLVDRTQAAGRYTAAFEASGLPSGIYLYRLTAGNAVEAKSMLLLR